jgi:hypothetical protein
MKSLRKRLTRWRTRHGGKGRRIPEKLWAEAVEIAAVEGIEKTARLLHLDSGRLGDRVAESKCKQVENVDQKPEFEFVAVELPKEERGWTIIKMVSSKGNELQIAGMASARAQSTSMAWYETFGGTADATADPSDAHSGFG